MGTEAQATFLWTVGIQYHQLPVALTNETMALHVAIRFPDVSVDRRGVSAAHTSGWCDLSLVWKLAVAASDASDGGDCGPADTASQHKAKSPVEKLKADL